MREAHTISPRFRAEDTRPAVDVRTCYWCSEPVAKDAHRDLQTRSGIVTVHTRCVDAMIRDGQLTDDWTEDTLDLDEDDI
jgi:hypothetical protein